MSNFARNIELYLSVHLGSINSVRQYRSTILEWSQFVGVDQILAPNLQDVWRYIQELKKRKGQKSRYNGSDEISLGTIKRKIFILKSFYKYLTAMKLCTDNPFDRPDLPMMRKKADPKRRTERTNYATVRKMIDSQGEDREGLRDKAILSLLYGSALRPSEVRLLTLNNIKKTPDGNYYARILMAKTAYREVLIAPWAANVIEKIIAQREAETGDSSAYMFCQYYGVPKKPNNKPLSESTFYRKFKNHAAEAGAPSTITPHSGRKTAISKMIEEGVPLRDVQKVTGHSSIQSVETYWQDVTGVDAQPVKKVKY